MTGLQAPGLLKPGMAGKPASAIAVLFKVLAPAVLTLCLWSQVWLGGATAFLLFLGTFALLLFAPRFFGTASIHIAWAQQAAFGEKIWLNRLLIPVPQGLNYRLTTLFLVFWAGVLVAIWGAFATLPLLSATGLAVAYSAQFACFCKLIHLYRIMKDKHPLYRFWAVSPLNDNSPAAAKPIKIKRRSA